MEASRPVTPLADWKAAARAGEAPKDAILHKQYVPDSVKEVEGSDRKIAFTISTGAVDRDRDTLKADGWKLDSYRKNAVVLWAHDSHALPIAKAESVRVQAGVLKAVAEFVPAEVYPFAETVLQMLKGGFLRATSVGFIPLPGKYKFNEERGGVDFEEQELLEFSVVPVPSNPEALIDAKSAGLNVLPLREWAIKTLDTFEPGSWMARADLEQMARALAEPRIVVPAFDSGPILAEFQKRGRVLSSANESRIRSAADAATAIGVALDEILAQVAEEEKAPVLYLAEDSVVNVTKEDVVAAVKDAVSERVRAEINAATGRLD